MSKGIHSAVGQSVPMDKRRQVLRAYRAGFDGTSSQAAAALTRLAVRRRFVRPRADIPGQTLTDWAASGKPPLWATLAAAEWLKEHYRNSEQ